MKGQSWNGELALLRAFRCPTFVRCKCRLLFFIFKHSKQCSEVGIITPFEQLEDRLREEHTYSKMYRKMTNGNRGQVEELTLAKYGTI